MGRARAAPPAPADGPGDRRGARGGGAGGGRRGAAGARRGAARHVARHGGRLLGRRAGGVGPRPRAAHASDARDAVGQPGAAGGAAALLRRRRPAAVPARGEPAGPLPVHRRCVPVPAGGRGPGADVRRRGRRVPHEPAVPPAQRALHGEAPVDGLRLRHPLRPRSRHPPGRPRQDRHVRRLDRHPRRHEGALRRIRPVLPDDVGVDDDQRAGADDPRVLPQHGDRPAGRRVRRAGEQGAVRRGAVRADRLRARECAGHGAGRHPQGGPGPEHLHLLHRVLAADDGRHPGMVHRAPGAQLLLGVDLRAITSPRPGRTPSASSPSPSPTGSPTSRPTSPAA